MRLTPAHIPWLLLALLAMGAAPAGEPADARRLTALLGGPDAVAESRAIADLLNAGDAAVPALAQEVRAGRTLSGRLIAVEALARIGTPAALDALLDLLKDEKTLAVRGQLCMQLGYARQRRAVPLIAAWLETIGPHAIDDVRGPKEVQLSTCYLRHLEALAMIGDERAIPAIEAFAARIPPNVGYGGFVTHFVQGGVEEALAELRDRAAFNSAVGRQPGLGEKIAPLMHYLQRDPVARFRLQESEVIRHTDQGRAIVKQLATGGDPSLTSAATQLLAAWDALDLSQGAHP